MNQNKRYTKPYTEQGITLVALVVTIVILLILAGITIASLTGENGLIGKSGEAKNATEKSQEKEELEVAVLRFTDKRGNLDATKIVNGLQKDIKNLKEVTNTDGKFPVKVEYKNGRKYGITKNGDIIEKIIEAGETAPNDSNAAYFSGEYIAVIPSGYTVSGIQGETEIEKGLVVRDGNQNEWVWIPVNSSDLELMYTENQTGWIMLGTIAPNEIVTKYRTLGTTLESRTLDRTTPGSTGYREPDVLSSNDTNQTFRTQAEFGDLVDMATKLKENYINMIDSVKKNKGFYIGRYELGKDARSTPQVKAGTVMDGTNWYNLYKACKNFSNDNVESRMIWGCQWDQVCRFIKNSKDINGEQIILDNSSTYGNYSGSTDNKTGTRNYCITNNIYDLAGNCWEWTQEAQKNDRRAVRGRLV